MRKRIFISLFFTVKFTSAHSQEFQKVDHFYTKDRLNFVGNYITSFNTQCVAIDLEVSEMYPIEVKVYNTKTKVRKSISLSGGNQSIGQLGFEYNIEKKSYGLRLGVYQHISLLSFNPVQFIYNYGSKNKGWTYRPEIGFGFWKIQVNYGYNLNFKKVFNDRGIHLLIVKFHL